MSKPAGAREEVDALFFSYFADVDRWHNDWPEGVSKPLPRAGVEDKLDQTMMGRIERQSVRIDGAPHDFPRFLSLVRYGHTREYLRWDAYTPTHLSGAYFQSLLAPQGINMRHVNWADRFVLERLAETVAPKFVLFSTSFMTEVPTILDGIQRVRSAWPEATVVVGGFMLGELERDVGEENFQRFMGAWGADAYVMSAMGEEALLGILKTSSRDLSGLDLPQTYVRAPGGGYEHSSEREEEGLPLDDSWVRWDRIGARDLYHTVHLRTARSCKFRCSFCSLFIVEGRLAFAEPETLRRELNSLRAHPHVRSLIFTDDTFNVPQKRFTELVRVLADFDYDWYSFYRSQFADEETVRLMRDSGCKGLFLGIESVDDKVLKNMNKATTVASYERGLEQLQKYQIPTHANFIIGFPGDTPDNAQRVVDFVDKWELPFFSVSPWFFAPSTPIYDQRKKFGVSGKYYSWEHATMNSAQAIELEQWMIKQPKRAVYMSQLSSDHFWSEIMLYSNGFSVEEARQAARTFNGFCGQDTSRHKLVRDPGVLRLKTLLESREMPLPAESSAQ
ncbi:MAG: B12-binding domain-containing radical SAM protein [bacterium]|nr:radical SAM protein [Planctomycetota bacterium]HIL52304.1 radical SAM protein [Planctomycetota bacterium]